MREEKQIEEREKRIINQREELRRLSKHIHNLTQSRDAWKKKAKRVGKQLYEVLNKQSEGEWIKHCNTYECSVCKEELFIEYAEDYDAIEDWELNFCPFCGAKMQK